VSAVDCRYSKALMIAVVPIGSDQLISSHGKRKVEWDKIEGVIAQSKPDM